MSRARAQVSGLNAGGSYRLLPVEMGLSTPNFHDVLLMGRQHGKSRKRQGAMGTTCASLRADAAKVVNRAYAKFWLHRGRWQVVILLTRAGEGVAWRAC